MKAMYIVPLTEIVCVETYSLLQSISGMNDWHDGGQAPENIEPQ